MPTDNSGAPVASSFGHPDAAAAPRRVSGTAFVTTVWYGLSDGAIYALIAIGFDIVITASGVLNFAQGAVVMFASFIGYQALSEKRAAAVPRRDGENSPDDDLSYCPETPHAVRLPGQTNKARRANLL